MPAFLDLTKERDAHIDHHLRKHPIVWLISVRPDGRPHAAAVWFLWDGESFLIFSMPKTQKIRNLQHNAHVILALDDTHKGDDPITIEGTATLLAPGTADATLPAYVEKYKNGLKEIGSTPEQMAREYSQAIRITPTRVTR
ncbi:MAG: TIGR03667 family PPOX class F420-dependent oxidoreductase [Ktedonobacteraceae bacterium]|nr:TIGR03667 family PPOX class F420-dependent oxidoreductase [Ktedonobacteraceae bacterium]